ncbi:MAG: nucleoid occlusion factor SlmA [Halieaceae bacterium]|jgi:TetR/AcrR family transcriptional regulator
MSEKYAGSTVSRQEQILQALAMMLEEAPLEKITTAKLAANVGVSEAALYRHFPSKAKMFESLITFAEETLFVRIGRISEQQTTAVQQCHHLLRLFLEFCEKNPGITQILTGRGLMGEASKLHDRVSQLYDRLETQLRQYLREAELKEGLRPRLPVANAANLMLTSAEGRISQFCRSGFKRQPMEGWEEQWLMMTENLMRPAQSAETSSALSR